MKFFIIFAVALLAVATAGANHDLNKKNLKKPVCFYKKQKCCYKYKAAGSHIKDVKCYKPYTVKKCEKKCEKVCKKVPKTIVKKECKMEAVYEMPKHWKNKHGKHYYNYKCKPVKKMKKVCCDKKIQKYVKVCKPYCKKVCKDVTAYKIIIKKTKYTKYAAKLECDALKAVGKVNKPKPYKNSKHIKTIDGGKVHKKPMYKKCY